MFAQNKNQETGWNTIQLSDPFTAQTRIHTQPKYGGGLFKREATYDQTS